MTAALTEVLPRVTAVGRAVSGSMMVLVASMGGVGVMMASMGWVGVMVATTGGVARISSGGKAGYSADECWKQHHGNEQQCSSFHLAFGVVVVLFLLWGQLWNNGKKKVSQSESGRAVNEWPALYCFINSRNVFSTTKQH